MSQQTTTRQCEGCSGTINNDDIIHRRAGLVGGILLCPICVDKKRQEIVAAQHAMQSQPHSAPPPVASQVRHNDIGSAESGIYIPPVHEGEKDIADETLSLVDDNGEYKPGVNRIRSFSEGSTLGGHHNDASLNRPISGPDQPATRVRTFHGKLTEAGLAHMDDLVNEWLDSNPDIFIKQSTSTIGVFEGKSKEPHLVLTLMY